MKHEDIIHNLTLEEKCHLLSGRDFWSTVGLEKKGIPSIILSDGPHGIRRQAGADDHLGLNDAFPATCFPTAVSIANSWDPALGEAIGEALGEEAACQKVSVLLGPGMNLKRSPLCGRNFEYFSEDPYLTGKIAAGYIRGIQKNGVSACPKHFAANNIELRRQASNSVVDERTLRELYLTGFEIAVKEAGPHAIMSSYNMVNGIYANENRHLLTDILRNEWGFDGFVVTDWGGCNDFVDGIRAGSNLEMPTTGGDSPAQLMTAVYEGHISEEEVDRRLDELLDVIIPTHEAVERYKGKSFDRDAHHALARRASEESIVLLKNEDHILPLAAGTKVALIGDFAETPRYQGAGSSIVNPTKLDSARDLIGDYPLELVGFEKGYPRVGNDGDALRGAAVELAKRADVVLLYLGLDEISESEGLDRSHMRLPQVQIDLLEAVSAVNPQIVIVLSAGSAIEMPWLDHSKALVYAGLCGQAGAGAGLRVLCGQVNPSGKLSETYPLRYEDEPTAAYFPAKERNVEYREGLFVGYRYFETTHTPVLFPFGFGMSYTDFAYSDLVLSDREAVFTLTNTGARDGAEVAQLYVSAKQPRIVRPEKELKGFTKVFLKAGESRTVSIPIDERAFRYFNTETGRWEIDGGAYEILIGASAADIRLSADMQVEGTNAPLPCELSELPSYASGRINDVPDREFERLLGTPIPDGHWSGTLQMNDALCQMVYAKSLKARLICKLMTKKIDNSFKAGKPDLFLLFAYNLPFRALGKISGGDLSQKMCEGLLTMANGHAAAFFKGLAILISGLKEQRKNLEKDKLYQAEKA